MYVAACLASACRRVPGLRIPQTPLERGRLPACADPSGGAHGAYSAGVAGSYGPRFTSSGTVPATSATSVCQVAMGRSANQRP